MKSLENTAYTAADASLPVWGEWIEIWPNVGRYTIPTASLPVWGEWIEINMPRRDGRGYASLPVWGEWIEM